jgi:antirestriction protein ArdC
MAGKIDVYETVTNSIIKALETGIVPWRKPWSGMANVPTSFASKKAYRGINRFLLDPMLHGFSSPYWMTYKQASERGGQVKAGSKGSLCVFWSVIKDRKDPTGKKNFFFLRHYTLFNLDQIDGIELPPNESPAFNPIETCENIVRDWSEKPTILNNGGDRACYRPSTDTVSMPLPETFTTPSAYYATLFHELGHATGHEKRLKRDLSGGFGSSGYAKEELVAELTAAMVCGNTGIGNELTENSAAYVAGWLRTLNADHKLVVSAAGAAQKAADMILGTKFDSPAADDEE